MIDWESEGTHILINPRMSSDQRLDIEKKLQSLGLKGHVWVSTSGTTAQNSTKWVALSKQALLASAKAVNRHLNSQKDDVWVHALPHFHVGGVGIFARAYLSQAKVVTLNQKWCPSTFQERCIEAKATLSALVPTQLYDLIKLKLEAPSSLRAVIVGGGGLNEELYFKARALGWNPLPSYGLSECCSQVATAPLSSLKKDDFPGMQLLEHISFVTIDKCNLLKIRSKSLLSCYAVISESQLEVIDPKQEGWFQTEDRVEMKGDELRHLGRVGDLVKVGGENVNLAHVNEILSALKIKLGVEGDQVLVAFPSERLGHAIHLVQANTCPKQLKALVDQYHLQTLPFERIREVAKLHEIPRTDLKKPKVQEIISLLSK
ncbi:MAG: AMP-binding protein [Chlamydiota bacterium]|nr:AMP-binding protein [Chlamydiota bacterium]